MCFNQCRLKKEKKRTVLVQIKVIRVIAEAARQAAARKEGRQAGRQVICCATLMISALLQPFTCCHSASLFTAWPVNPANSAEESGMRTHKHRHSQPSFCRAAEFRLLVFFCLCSFCLSDFFLYFSL